MKNRRRIKDEQNLQYNLKIWKKNDDFYILNYISEDITLVQLMDSLLNVNRAISIVGHWLFYSNFEKSLCLTQESVDVIRYPSIGKEQVATFQSVFYAVRYSWETGNLKKG